MTDEGFEAEAETEVEVEPVRRNIVRLVLVIVALLLGLGGLVAVGGMVLAGLLPSPDANGEYCNPVTGRCSNLSLAEIEAQTGYDLPDDSVVLSSSMGPGSFLDGADYRVLVATVELPAGSTIPDSDEPLSSISVQSTEADGRIVVSVETANSASAN